MPPRPPRLPSTDEGAATPGLSRTEILRRVAAARAAVLGTVGEDGRPHQVPITFALDAETLYTAVDHKPKSTRALKRLVNIQSNPSVSVLVHSYTESWSSLWWCRLDGTATVHREGAGLSRARELLGGKYEQYRDRDPEGPAVLIHVEHASGWEAERA